MKYTHFVYSSVAGDIPKQKHKKWHNWLCTCFAKVLELALLYKLILVL